MKKDKLFEIHDFVLRNDKIIVQIVENNNIENSIEIPVDKFKEYLDRHERLFFEHNDISTGQLLTRAYILTFENYWYDMDREDKLNDLYDFIITTCFDFTKAIDNMILKNNLTHYLW